MNTEHTLPTYDQVKKKHDATRLENAIKKRDKLIKQINKASFTDKRLTSLIDEYHNVETLINILTNKKR